MARVTIKWSVECPDREINSSCEVTVDAVGYIHELIKALDDATTIFENQNLKLERK